MKQGYKPAKKHLAQLERCFKLLEHEKLNTDEIAIRLFGSNDPFSKRKVYSLLSRLRKMKLDFYPEKAEVGGKWKLPKNLSDHKEAIMWKEDRHFAGFFRLVKFIGEAEQKYPQLKGTGQKLINRLNETEENEIRLITPKRTEARSKATA